MATYIWTKKRKKARAHLVTLVIFAALYSVLAPSLGNVVDSGMTPQHPVLRVFLGILILLGFYSIADDARILLIYEEDEKVED